MPIKPGDCIPSATLFMMGADGPTSSPTNDLFKGKKVAMFGLPGAFTPTCSAMHVPSYLNNAAALKEKGHRVHNLPIRQRCFCNGSLGQGT